ncbi:hypothetical protein V6Z12_D05G320100 [Gossypium hirsutum]
MFLNINSIILKYTTSRMILRLEENEELYPIDFRVFRECLVDYILILISRYTSDVGHR